MISGSGTGAGAAAPPPARVSSSGVASGSDVGSGSCVVDGAGDSDRGACVVGIGDGVGLVVGDGVGLGVGDGEGVGVGDGDGEAVTVGDGAGVGEPASSATDGTPQPAIPTPRTRVRRTGAAALSILRRCGVDEGTDSTEERDNMGEIGDNMGVLTKASSNEKGW